MNDTPYAERTHIVLIGRCNSGKSALLNALAGQRHALVSDAAGTTTDAVNKAMELPGVGAVVLTDTAGFDDEGPLGLLRRAQTERAAERADIALIVCTEPTCEAEAEWAARFRARGVGVVAVRSKCDLANPSEASLDAMAARLGVRPIPVSARSGEGIDRLREAIAAAACREPQPTLTGDLVSAGDTVLLVMPQDAAAPKGRLILPQVQTLRELLDRGCTAVCCTPEEMRRTLAALKNPPRLVVTDSQAFAAVAALTPEETMLTSFSVLYARYKGDIRRFVAGAKAILRLREDARVLIAEACTHSPASEDIGRAKIPRLLRARAGEGLRIDFASGDDFPADLSPYDLVIHCGGCMFNRRHMLARIERAAAQEVPITNYGVAIAALQGILDRIVYPGKAQ